jgi:hypothetical protein
LTSYLGLLTQTEVTVYPAGRRPAWLCCTTSRLSCGSRRCRRRRRSLLRRPSTIQHRWLEARSCISEIFCTLSDSRRRGLLLCTRIPPRAPSGVTTSLADGNVPSTSTSGSTSPHPELSDALVKVPTASQMADILTQGQHLPQVLACVNGLLHQLSTSST